MGGYVHFDGIEMIANLERPGERDRIIRLLQAKTRMLEAALEKSRAEAHAKNCEDDYMTYHRALLQGVDLRDDIKLFENYRTVTEEETVREAKDLPDDDPYAEPTKVTLVESQYEDLDMTPVRERKEGLPIAGTNEVHPVVFDSEGLDEVDIKVNKQDCDILFPKELETETHVIIRIKKRG